MSSSSSSTMLGSSENSPTRTPQPDPTDDAPTVQEGANRAEHAENIANGAQDDNVRLQEQIKQLKAFFKEKEQKLVEEKEAAERDTLQAKATAKTARAEAGEILGAFRQFVSDSEKREKVFLDARLDTEKEIQRAVGSIQETETQIQEISGAAHAAAGRAETAAHNAQKASGKAQMVAGEAQTVVRTATDGLQAAVRTARDEAQTAVRTAAGAQTVVRTATGEAQKAIRTAVDQAQRDQETAKEQKLESRHKWFFWIILALVANALLWISMLYGIFRIEDWGSQRRMYLVRVWMIFIAPLLVVMMLLFSPCLSKFKDYVCHRYLEVEPWDFGILLINAAACFTFVVAYLYKSAIPRYHHPVFESSTNFTSPLRWPTVAFINNNFVDLGLISVSPASCLIGDSTSSVCSPGALSQPESSIPDNRMFVFNSSLSSPENQTVLNLAVKVVITIEIIYNSSYSAPSWTIYTADSRMSLNNLMNCGFVNYQTSPMLTDVDISLTMENIHDELNFIGTTFATPSESDQNHKDCESGLRKLLSAQEPFYSLYTASITTSDPITNRTGNCSAASDQQQCGSVSITLSFGSSIVRTTETKPGISKQEVWINAGAIVGAIQFFAWLLRGG